MPGFLWVVGRLALDALGHPQVLRLAEFACRTRVSRVAVGIVSFHHQNCTTVGWEMGPGLPPYLLV